MCVCVCAYIYMYAYLSIHICGKDLYVLFDGFLCLYYETTTKPYIELEDMNLVRKGVAPLGRSICQLELCFPYARLFLSFVSTHTESGHFCTDCVLVY